MADSPSHTERGSSRHGQARDIFVGRHQEMAELQSALDDALSGQGRLVMLVGEPGIGKTRTAQELASYAEYRGVRVFWGRCYEDRGAPPYWPWLQTIRSYVLQAGTEQLAAEMGPGAAAIAEIVAEIRGKLPDLEAPPVQEQEAARFGLFDSISTFLKNAAESQPLMLVLDDLHWADKPSLLLLEFLARDVAGSTILVLGCYRDMELSRQHPLAETLGQLAREPVFRRQALRGLGQDELGQFIEATTGVQLSRALTESLHTHTEGNPFFMIEVVRLMLESGELTAERIATSQRLRIPESVREVIGQRLNRLSKRCNQALATASIIGREFDFRLLNRVGESIPEGDLLEAISEAENFHLITEVPDQMDRYQFSHGLIQQTLAEEVTASQRVRLHARIAETLEELCGANVEAHAAELAHHFAEAALVLGTGKLVHYSLLAGEQALSSYAYEDALTHFERGLATRNIAVSGTEAAPDEEAANLLFGLARAQSATVEGHQLGEVFSILSRAFEYFVEAGNVAQAVAAAEFPIAQPVYRFPGLSQLLARALALVPADSREAGRLLSRYGVVLGIAEGEYQGAQEALGRAISIARREGDLPLEIKTEGYAASVSYLNIRWQESLDSGLRAIELATGDENPLSDALPRYWTASALLWLGDLDAARPHALVLRDLAQRRITPRSVASNSLIPITYLSCLEGDWRASREYSDRGLEVSPLNPLVLLPRVLLEYETGETAQGEVYLEQLLEATHRAGPGQALLSLRMLMTIAAIAHITGVPDRLEAAEAAAQAALSNQSVFPQLAMYAKTGLALLAAQKSDLPAAEEHYAYFQGHRGTMIQTVSSVDRLLGLLSQTMGNPDLAAEHFEDALTFCRKAGYRPELAWTCCDYADMLLVGAGLKPVPTLGKKAMDLLDESLTISTELGMRPLVERVTEQLERIQTKPSPAPAYPGGLSQRGVEVLRLIAVGKTDREIADELFISFRTVGNHVRNILNKTNTANRTEAATFAAHQGLT